MTRQELTQEQLKSSLHYDPETGFFTRLKRTSAAVVVGEIAGSIHSSGYVYICVLNAKHLAHRLAWLYTNGSFPKHCIDHINGTRYDNRIANLRDASSLVNSQNIRAATARSLSGILGVTKVDSKWRVLILRGGKQAYLGRFDTVELAQEAYLNAKRQSHQGCTI